MTGRQGPAARLRRMTAADLPAVVALERALFPEDPWSQELFGTELSSRTVGRYYLVANDGDQLVGYAGLLAVPTSDPRGGQGDVLTMAVAAGHWGRGIGSMLLQALLAEAGRRGCSEVFLEVRADNPRAQLLYRRHGFTDVGLRRGYYQPSGTDAIVMRRPAGPPEPPVPRVDPVPAVDPVPRVDPVQPPEPAEQPSASERRP